MATILSKSSTSCLKVGLWEGTACQQSRIIMYLEERDEESVCGGPANKQKTVRTQDKKREFKTHIRQPTILSARLHCAVQKRMDCRLLGKGLHRFQVLHSTTHTSTAEWL